MSQNRKFHGRLTTRLIVSVDAQTVEVIDQLIGYPLNNGKHPARGNRSEFVRQAIERELARWW